MYYLVRTGHLKEAIETASQHAAALNSQEELFTTLLQTWVESPDRRYWLSIVCIFGIGTYVSQAAIESPGAFAS